MNATIYPALEIPETLAAGPGPAAITDINRRVVAAMSEMPTGIAMTRVLSGRSRHHVAAVAAL